MLSDNQVQYFFPCFVVCIPICLFFLFVHHFPPLHTDTAWISGKKTEPAPWVLAPSPNLVKVDADKWLLEAAVRVTVRAVPMVTAAKTKLDYVTPRRRASTNVGRRVPVNAGVTAPAPNTETAVKTLMWFAIFSNATPLLLVTTDVVLHLVALSPSVLL